MARPSAAASAAPFFAPYTHPHSTTSPARAGTLAARVTAQLIDALNNGVRPWVQPWDTAAALALPLRHNGIAYRGGNILILWSAARTRNFTSRYWLTFQQARARGGFIRRGERATHITYYAGPAIVSADTIDTAPTATDSTPAHRAVLRSFAVFSANQIDDLPAHFYAKPSPVTDCDDADLSTRFNRVPAHVTHGGARACYNPATDTIHLPTRHSFVATAQYFATRLHELAHWTGHPSRLARDAFLNPTTRTPAAYAREELVAELTAAFLGAELNLPVDHLEDHAAYLDHWLTILDRDPSALLTAAGHAQRAADFLLPFLNPAPEPTPDRTPDRTPS